jgi:hypothetical protein
MGDRPARYEGYEGDKTRTFRHLPGFRNLLAWQAADDLAASVHKLTLKFDYRYSKLVSQMLGSASSVKANIRPGTLWRKKEDRKEGGAGTRYFLLPLPAPPVFPLPTSFFLLPLQE